MRKPRGTTAYQITGSCKKCGAPIQFYGPATLLARSCPRCAIKPEPEDPIRTYQFRELRQG